MIKFFHIFLRVLISTAISGFCALAVIILYTNAQLPPVNILEDIQLQVPLKIYTSDNKLIGEYGEKRRTPIPIQDIPQLLKLAILATEDRRFYEHNGVDLRGLARATINLILSGTKAQGASTITMQVARNFFLPRKKTFGRKLNEVLLAIKIEKELPKDKILELYLNKIYFGKRAYGVQAASQVYYGMNVDKLNLAQMAMIAGLPQAPSAINPINNPDAALKRRTHVLKRMLHYGFINEKQLNEAINAPIAARYHGRTVEVDAPYVAEMARKELVEKFGPDIYTSGFVAYTTVNSRLQTIASHSVQEGLLEYDKRHGYRGPYARLPVPTKGQIDFASWVEHLKTYPITSLVMPAGVISVKNDSLRAILPNQQQITVPFTTMRWASKQLTRDSLGAPPTSAQEIANIADVIYVERGNNQWQFSQLPEAESALVAIHPKNGAILALIGGFDFEISNFNRATQATRQPGSNFKPFVYAAALEHGFTAATIINDAPIIYRDEATQESWRPQNNTRQFYGPTRLRVGLVKSHNLVSIRLLQALGIGKAIKTIQRFGFPRQNLPHSLSLALGSGTASPLEIAVGYAAFANGGYKISPYIVERVINSQDKVIFQANPPTACVECQLLVEHQIDPAPTPANAIDALAKPQVPAQTMVAAPQIIDPQTAYIMTSILQDAIQTGTGRLARALNRADLAGKTGTTNNLVDAWYTGYNQSLVASVWLGFDESYALQEYGSQAALPIWMKFMGAALQNVPQTTLPQPRGLVTVKIDPATGLLARPGQANAIFEIFRQETVPVEEAQAINPMENSTITPIGNNGETLF